MDSPKQFTVIGAGVVGLSTALCLQKKFPSSEITVIADKFCDDTLSSGAGGLFRPEITAHYDHKRVRKWCADSLTYFLEIINSADCAKAGMQLVSGYHISSSPYQCENTLLQELLPHYRKLNEKELELFPEQYKYGTFNTTVIIDCRYYLPWMKSKFESDGGKIIMKHISEFSEVSHNCDIIFNCTGLGAKELLQDKMMVSIRGQTIKVKAPWIKNFYFGNEVYVIPGLDYVTLGGIKDYGSWNMNVNSHQKQYIWEKCTELVPSLKKAEFAWDWVGLRPYRQIVRVDTSFVKCGENFKMVINNYGHGAHGVSLSWGTALEATEIAKQALLQKEFIISKL